MSILIKNFLTWFNIVQDSKPFKTFKCKINITLYRTINKVLEIFSMLSLVFHVEFHLHRVIHLSDPGSNLGIVIRYYLILFGLRLNSFQKNLGYQNCLFWPSFRLFFQYCLPMEPKFWAQ
jgi:hypothetical protein